MHNTSLTHHPSDEPIHMAVIGDSLAYGTGAGSSQNGFAHRVFAQLEKAHPNSTYVNFAVPGSRIGDVVAFQVRRLRETNANLVLVVVGTNDLLETRDIQQFADMHIPEFAKPATSALCASLDAQMHRIAREHGAHFLDLYALTSSREPGHRRYLSSDGFHPSASGYAEIARAAYPVIEAAITR